MGTQVERRSDQQAARSVARQCVDSVSSISLELKRLRETASAEASGAEIAAHSEQQIAYLTSRLNQAERELAVARPAAAGAARVQEQLGSTTAALQSSEQTVGELLEQVKTAQTEGVDSLGKQLALAAQLHEERLLRQKAETLQQGTAAEAEALRSKLTAMRTQLEQVEQQLHRQVDACTAAEQLATKQASLAAAANTRLIESSKELRRTERAVERAESELAAELKSVHQTVLQLKERASTQERTVDLMREAQADKEQSNRTSARQAAVFAGRTQLPDQ